MNGAKVKILLLSLLAMLIIILSACQPALVKPQAEKSTAKQEQAATKTEQPAKKPEQVSSYVGQFSLSPSSGIAGSVVSASGIGFEPNMKLEIVWQRFRGSWKVKDASFYGREFKEQLEPMAVVTTDADGKFQTKFTVPDGFGFIHDVLVTKGSQVLNKAGFAVTMQAAMSSSRGPVGTPIAIDVKGMGWRPLESSWTLLYDNKFTGWISAVTTEGIAQAVIPATGAPGKHIIQIIHGSFTFPYMNMQQSPEPDRPSWTFEFTITEGGAVLPAPASEQSLPIEKGAVSSKPADSNLWTDILSGPIGTPLTLKGSQLPPGSDVEILWFRVKGNRVSGQGWEEFSTSLARVAVGSGGEMEFPFKAPDDLGGPHRIEARVKGEKVAETAFTITPSAFALEPSSGPAGTTMTIHLKGVGWTETANIYNVVYDNAYLGYACGFNSQGDVTVYLPAAGEPGWHFIDLYPGIYKGEDIKQVNNFRIPQLTSKDDHPGERLPAFRFAFQITSN